MNQYIACGQVIDSEIELPELEAAHSNRTCSISIRLSRESFPEPCDWFHRWIMADGSIWLQIGRQHRDYLLRFPEMADFLVEAANTTINVFADPRSTAATIRHLLLDQVLPLVLANAGKLVLHASAVLLPSGVAVFMGQSGKGKSTLAATFCQAGYPLITDDCLLLEPRTDAFYGFCSYPGLRLWEDSACATFPDATADLSRVAHYSEKLRVSKTPEYLGTHTASAPIRSIYMLEPDEEAEETTFHRLSGARTVVSILEYVFHLDVKDPESLKLQFDLLTQLAKTCPVYRLSFPKGYEHLSSIRSAILEHMHD